MMGKGIHLGVINNPGGNEDIELNDFLKRKTLGHLLDQFNFKSNDYDNPDDDGFVYHHFEDFSSTLSLGLKSSPELEWLVLFAAGTLVNDPLSMEAFLEKIPPAKESKIVAYAHLLIPDDYSSFVINTQMVAINCVILRRHFEEILPWRDFRGNCDISFSKYGDHHDNYTPWWIYPTKEVREKVWVDQSSAWLVPLLKLGYRVFNFPEESARRGKLFFYMDSKEQLELGRSYLNGEGEEKLLSMAEKIDKRPVMEAFLKFDQLYASSSDYILLDNTNSFYMSELAERDFTAVLLPCGGFNYLKPISLLKDNLEEIYHYDISPSAVEWREQVINNFSRESLIEIVQEFKRDGKDTIGELPLEKLEPFFSSNSDVRHQYRRVDILEGWRDLLLEVKEQGHQKILFDLSNILCYSRTIYKHGVELPCKFFKELISFLEDNFNNWCVITDSFVYGKKNKEKFSTADLYKNGPREHRERRGFYGHLAYKLKSNISLGHVWQSWENSAIDFNNIFTPLQREFEDRINKTLNDDALFYDREFSWGNFYRHNYLPFVPLEIFFDYQKFLQEAKAIYDMGLFVSHRMDEPYGWSSFVIHGLGDGMTKSWESYHPEEEEDLQAYHFPLSAQEHAPATVNFFSKEFGEQIGCNSFTRIRFMALAPGGFIPPHYDSYTSTCPGPINMALNQPDNCHLFMWRGSSFTPDNCYGPLPFVPGVALNIDVGNSHMVYNLSDEVRFHIIAHIEPRESAEKKAYYDFKGRSLNRWSRERDNLLHLNNRPRSLTKEDKETISLN